MTDIARIREVIDAATPGPWEHAPLPIGDGPLPDDALVFGPDGDSSIRVSWNPGRDNDRWADARAIALAHNLMPALLDVAEAALAWSEAPPVLRGKEERALRAALDALDAKVKEALA